MKRLQRDSVILALIEAMHKHGSWCGETHIQKTSYFLQNLLNVPLGFDFILYKHGAYSFDLSDALAQMQADWLVAIKPQPYPYGPSLVPGENKDFLVKNFSKTRAQYQRQVNFVARRLAPKNVAELERLSTAMYVTLEYKKWSHPDERPRVITQLKPHVKPEDAEAAVEEFDKIQKGAAKIAA